MIDRHLSYQKPGPALPVNGNRQQAFVCPRSLPPPVNAATSNLVLNLAKHSIDDRLSYPM
jgi:hypothetical protein